MNMNMEYEACHHPFPAAYGVMGRKTTRTTNQAGQSQRS
jgi:hypothetical protein